MITVGEVFLLTTFCHFSVRLIDAIPEVLLDKTEVILLTFF